MKQIILLLIATTFSQFGFSQNRAPSCWLKYQDSFQGDILINTVKVQSPSPTYTYYCNLQWNAGMEGGGYCGIQEHPQGKNFIFSIWDPVASTDPITAPYTHNGTQIESFGGEGTGLKSWNFDIGWDTDQWYSFVTRAWDSNTHTMFGYWVFNHSNQEWYHLVTMDYPLANVRFNSSTGSFIEDWLGNGSNTREVHHKEGWKRKTSDLSWNPLTSSFFERVSPDAGAVNYIDNYDGGVATDYYFMKSGGAVTPVTNTSNTMLSLSNSNTDHGFLTGEVSQLNTTNNGNVLTLDWDVNISKSPQFSYHVAIYDNSTFSGGPIIQYDQNVPHERTLDIDISSLIVGNEYYIQFYIIDIFDNQSTSITDSFIQCSNTTGTDTRIECNSYTWIDGNIYTENNNTATHNIVGGAINGCDSLVTLNLTINNVSDLTTTMSGTTITANNTSAAYQWLDCDNNFTIISGETNSSYTPAANGNYAVQLSENSCTDTSTCIAINTVGFIENSFGDGLTIYPNPTDGNFSINLGDTYNFITITITDLNGKLILSSTYNEGQLINLKLEEPAGIYLLKTVSGDKKAVIRLVKE